MKFYKYLKLNQNKGIEFEASIRKSQSTTILWFDVNWTRRCDHAGFSINLVIFDFLLGFAICDNRHWNNELNAWEK